MPTLTIEEVRHVARLAALELDDDAAQAMRADLGTILDYIAALDAVDVSGVEATFHPAQRSAPLRPDEVQPSLPRERALAAAPESDAGGFAVPKVLEGDA
jgi:aspartyl-tRNA(Asn)/glutamyl-tRNA(Gln) amidotransferase subunit C